MKVKRVVLVLCALLLPLGALALALANGCGDKDEEPPPAPAPTPLSTPAPTPTVTMTPEEDAGVDAAEDADADAPKPTGNFDPTGIKACCSALSQNAANAPLDQKPMYLQAAAVCQGLINNPQGRAALGQLRGILRGANLPSACK